MFEVENIRDWRNHDVVDPEGHKIGLLEAVYVDTSTDEPAFAAVRTGIIGRHRLTFAPLAVASHRRAVTARGGPSWAAC
jgi:PRC-barrel domain